MFSFQQDLWLWDLDWSVQDVRTKKPKPAKKRKKKEEVKEETEEEHEEDIFAKIPPAEDVMYKQRQQRPGYPRGNSFQYKKED